MTVLRDVRSVPTAGHMTTNLGRIPAARERAMMLYPAVHQRFWAIFEEVF